MINIGPGELLAICAIALIVLGPDKLPQALRTLGRVTSELRRVSTGFQEDIRSAVDDALRDEDDMTPKERARPPSGARDSEQEEPSPTSLDTLEEIGATDETVDEAADEAPEVSEAGDPEDVAGGQALKKPAKRNGSSGATGS